MEKEQVEGYLEGEVHKKLKMRCVFREHEIKIY